MKMITQECVVVDLDGTLIDTKHLLHLARPEAHDYSAFHAAAVYAPPIRWTLRVVRDWQAIGIPVVVCTARSEQYRGYTEEWLRKWFPSYTALHMRRASDTREDHLTKKELIEDIQLCGWQILRAYDDNPSVIHMYRDLGLRTVTVRAHKHG